MTHELKLQAIFFDLMKAGTKTIECRLFDEKRQQINLGDTLVFKRAPELNESLNTEVIGLLRYSTFSELFADFPPEVFGMQNSTELENLLFNFYTKEDEEKYGVIGIRVRVN